MKDYKFKIKAGGTYRLDVRGNFFMLKDCAQKLRFIVRDSEFELEEGRGVKNLPFVFQHMLIFNDLLVDVDVVVVVGFGEYVDNRLIGSVEVSNNVELKNFNFAVWHVAASTSPTVIPANPLRKKIKIFNPSPADWTGHVLVASVDWLGGENGVVGTGANAAFRLYFGQSVEIETGAAVKVAVNTAVNSLGVRYLEYF